MLAHQKRAEVFSRVGRDSSGGGFWKNDFGVIVVWSPKANDNALRSGSQRSTPGIIWILRALETKMEDCQSVREHYSRKEGSALGRHEFDPLHRLVWLNQESPGTRMTMSVCGLSLLVAFVCPALSWGSGKRQENKNLEASINQKSAQRGSSVPLHVKVYHQPGRFGGWPANHGIWSWGNEILVGFSAGYFQDHGPERHAIDHDKPEEHLLARSRDGGETWTIENPAARGALIPVGKA
jgi:hypothetical protein